jgi:hypothetical protein
MKRQRKGVEREELQGISSRAMELSKTVANPYWIGAWTQLALAADHLDAMLARSEVCGKQRNQNWKVEND